MNGILLVSIALVGLAGVYFLFKPKALPQYAPRGLPPPMVPATQDPRQANSICEGAVGLAAVGTAAYFGGAAGAAAASKTGAAGYIGVGVCSVADKVYAATQATAKYLGNAGAGFVAVATLPITGPIAVGSAVKSAVSEISSWF